MLSNDTELCDYYHKQIWVLRTMLHFSLQNGLFYVYKTNCQYLQGKRNWQNGLHYSTLYLVTAKGFCWPTKMLPSSY